MRASDKYGGMVRIGAHHDSLSTAIDRVEASPEDLVASDQAGRAVPSGTGLTRREVEVLGMMAEGMLATTIASRLDVSPRTVHKHLGNVYRKLGVHDRMLAVRQGQILGLVPLARTLEVPLSSR